MIISLTIPLSTSCACCDGAALLLGELYSLPYSGHTSLETKTPPRSIHTILLGLGGTIYNIHTIDFLKDLVLISLTVKKLASKLYTHYFYYAAKFVRTKRKLSSTIISSYQEPVSGQVCNPPVPRIFLLFLW